MERCKFPNAEAAELAREGRGRKEAHRGAIHRTNFDHSAYRRSLGRLFDSCGLLRIFAATPH